MNIGSVTLSAIVVAAPMAGVTDAAVRTILSEMGAGLVTTEMVSAKGLFYGSRANRELLDKGSVTCPTAVQIFGRDPLIMAREAERLSEDFDIIDVNMGCPVAKIVKNGEGSALMKEPELACEILSTLSRVVPVPVTVKIRKGFDSEHVCAAEFARMAEQAGVSAITVHGRTREEMYSGRADREIIAKVKEAVSIPVIANGDIRSPEDAASMLSETGADAVAIGRGLLGNPWLMRQTVEYLASGTILPEPDIEERRAMMLRQLSLMVSYKGERRASREILKHLAWYSAGLEHSSALRARINELSGIDSVRAFIEEDFGAAILT